LAAPDDATVLNARAVTGNVTLGPAGGSQPLPTMMTYTAITYCICYEGIFPTQG
jgi:microcystin-dependent protein